MEYMDQYLQKFHDRVQVLSEFQDTNKDRQKVKKAYQELAAGRLDAHLARLEADFELSSTRRKRLAVEDRKERAQVM